MLHTGDVTSLSSTVDAKLQTLRRLLAEVKHSPQGLLELPQKAHDLLLALLEDLEDIHAAERAEAEHAAGKSRLFEDYRRERERRAASQTVSNRARQRSCGSS